MTTLENRENMILRNLARYDTLFEDFLQNIALTKTQASLIDDALEDAFGIFMSNYSDIDIYTQGSYAMGTIVKPLTANQAKDGIAGEYDVDIVLERSGWGEPVDSLEETRKILTDEYGGRTDEKQRESCERVNFSKDCQTEVAFHVDYVPVLSEHYGAFRYVAKRSENDWHDSDTKRLKEWFLDYAAENQFVQALVVILKRIRDFAGLTNLLPSICVMAMVCENYRDTGSYAGDLIKAIARIIDKLDRPYNEIDIRINKVEENLAEKISEDGCKKILKTMQKCYVLLTEEFEGEDEPDLAKVQEILSNDFPSDLTKYPQCLESLRNRKLGIELDGSLMHEEILEKAEEAKYRTRLRSKFFGKGKTLEFRVADYDEKRDYGIRWQVLNAEGSDDRRGELFEAKAKGSVKNSNKFVNFETESYRGEHWIKYYIYDKDTKKVVEVGKKYFVEVNI